MAELNTGALLDFAGVLDSGRESKGGTRVATVSRIDSDGVAYVSLPGGVDETPIATTGATYSIGDTVYVSIDGGKLRAIGNVSNPSISSSGVNTIVQPVKELAELSIKQLEAESARIGELEADTAKIHDLTADELSAATGYIADLTAGEVTASNIVADHAKVGSIDVSQINADHATVAALDANYAQIDLANIANGTIKTAMIDDAAITTAKINNAAVTDAKIADATISAAKITNLMGQNGWLDKLMVQTGLLATDGTIWQLDAIQVNATNITAGTIDVERLIVTVGGEKYLVHIDTSGSTPTTTYEKLDGDIIEPRTITADKIVANSITANELTTQNIVGTGGWINLANGTFSYVNAQSGASIVYDGTALTIQGSNLNTSVGKLQTVANPNLSPFFEYLPFAPDKTSQTASSDEYWVAGWNQFTSLVATPLDDGWIHVKLDNTSGSSAIRADFDMAPCASVGYGEDYTFLFEFRNNSSSGTSTGTDFYVVQSANNQFWGGAIKKNLEGAGNSNNTNMISDFVPGTAGVYRKRFVKTSETAAGTTGTHITGDIIALCTLVVRAGIGAVAEYDVRVSLYEGEYTGPWKPYSGSTLYASQAELKVQADRIGMVVSNQDASSSLELTSNALNVISQNVNIKGTDGTTTVISGGRIQANSISIGDLSGSIGGRNLLFYSEALTPKWTTPGGTVSNGIATLTKPSSGECRIYQMPANNAMGKWTSGETYTMSIEAKRGTGSGNLKLVPRNFPEKTVTLTANWARYSVTGTCSADATASVTFEFSGGSTGDTILLRKPKIELGNKATDWTPAPEDQTAYTDERVGYYTRSCQVGQSTGTVSNNWYKFAYTRLAGTNLDHTIQFTVQAAGNFNDTKRDGTLRAHVRSGSTVGTFSSAQLEWVKRGDGISLSDFVLAYKATSGTDVKVELWCKVTQAWSGFQFFVDYEATRTAISTSELWTIYNNWGQDKSEASITSGYTQVTSTDVDAARKTATNYIEADSSGIKIFDSSTSKTAGTYQHQTSGDTTFYIDGKKRSTVDANGLEVFDGNANAEVSVAKFGSTARIGKQSGESRMELNSNSFQMIDKFGDAFVKFEDLSNSTLVLNYVGDGSTSVFGIEDMVYADESTISVKVNGSTATWAKSSYSSIPPYVSAIRITPTPADGAVIEISYKIAALPSGYNPQVSAYTFGVRASGNIGVRSFSSGSGNVVSGTSSAAFGISNTASNHGSFAMGFGNSATGQASVAMGRNTSAEKEIAEAHGLRTKATRENQIVIGTFNEEDQGPSSHSGGVVFGRYGKYAVIVGNGTADDSRSNAAALQWDGTLELATALPFASGGTASTGTESVAQSTVVSSTGTNVSITTWNYYMWGKLAVMYAAVKPSAAQSANWTAFTVNTGYCPPCSVFVGTSVTTHVAYLTSDGKCIVRQAGTANTTYYLLATYLLA